MLLLKRFDLVELHCANRLLVWEELAQFVESDDLLILDEILTFGILVQFNSLTKLIFTWT